jgi:hypothetical protein
LQRTKQAVAVITALAAIALAGFSGVAYASHQLSDVSDTSPFHDEIATIIDAGIASGYEDGTFRPGAPVTRQAMAAFLDRGLTRARFQIIGGAVVQAGPQLVGEISIDAPGAETGSGFVLVTATGMASGSSCPCNVAYDLVEAPAGGFTDGLRGATIGVPGGSSGVAHASIAVQRLFPIDGGAQGTYRLIALLDGSGTAAIDAEMTAVYIPLEGTAQAP